MRTYALTREDGEISRFTVRSEKGVIYVYRRYPDRWDITKLKESEIAEAASQGISGDSLLESAGVDYRIMEGHCTCPGFSYHRGMCKHLDEISIRR